MVTKSGKKFDLFNELNSKGWIPEGEDYDSLTVKKMEAIKAEKELEAELAKVAAEEAAQKEAAESPAPAPVDQERVPEASPVVEEEEAPLDEDENPKDHGIKFINGDDEESPPEVKDIQVDILATPALSAETTDEVTVTGGDNIEIPISGTPIDQDLTADGDTVPAPKTLITAVNLCADCPDSQCKGMQDSMGTHVSKCGRRDQMDRIAAEQSKL